MEVGIIDTPPGLDSDTVHIRCGSDIRDGLAQAGIEGGFLVYADPVCQGPVPEGDDLLEVRAAYLSRDGTPIDEVRARLDAEQRALRAATTRERVVLWFEHDPYDQLILSRILAFFVQCGRPDRLELICVDRYPGVERFIGLGQLPPTALGHLWTERREVTAEQLLLGERVWAALRRPSPRALAEIATSDACRVLPPMGPALIRHLQELPWLGDGLGLTERLTLGRLEQGSTTAGDIFRHLTLEADPLPFLGDTMYWTILEELLRAGEPPLRVVSETADRRWSHRRVTLTDTGREVLAGRDWLSCGPRERWVGGVRIAADAPAWRWDPGVARPGLRPKS